MPVAEDGVVKDGDHIKGVCVSMVVRNRKILLSRFIQCPKNGVARTSLYTGACCCRITRRSSCDVLRSLCVFLTVGSNLGHRSTIRRDYRMTLILSESKGEFNSMNSHPGFCEALHRAKLCMSAFHSVRLAASVHECFVLTS